MNTCVFAKVAFLICVRERIGMFCKPCPLHYSLQINPQTLQVEFFLFFNTQHLSLGVFFSPFSFSLPIFPFSHHHKENKYNFYSHLNFFTGHNINILHYLGQSSLESNLVFHPSSSSALKSHFYTCWF